MKSRALVELAGAAEFRVLLNASLIRIVSVHRPHHAPLPRYPRNRSHHNGIL